MEYFWLRWPNADWSTYVWTSLYSCSWTRYLPRSMFTNSVLWSYFSVSYTTYLWQSARRSYALMLKQCYLLVPGNGRISPYTVRRTTIVILSQVLHKRYGNILPRQPFLAVHGRKRAWLFDLGSGWPSNLPLQDLHFWWRDRIHSNNGCKSEMNGRPRATWRIGW